MQRKEIRIDQLQFGMYVAELDRPWTDTPFMFQGFYLRTEQQLEALRKFCKHVYVDLERSEKLRPPAPAFPIKGSTEYPETASIEAEFQPAAQQYEQIFVSVAELLKPAARQGGVLDSKEVKESVKRLADSVVRNPDAMLLVTRLREQSAEVHARALQVSIYMLVFARFLELRRDELELLGLLGLLQDIGKTRLPAAILEKKGPLTEEEFGLVKTHTLIGGRMLEGGGSRLMTVARTIALSHHEKWDGTGYPHGLAGETIPLSARIVALADAASGSGATPKWCGCGGLRRRARTVHAASAANARMVVIHASASAVVRRPSGPPPRRWSSRSNQAKTRCRRLSNALSCAIPRNSRGRVYCGCSSAPSLKLSSTMDRASRICSSAPIRLSRRADLISSR